ncbi:MAG: transketolase family protein [Oscillospiraceae bacterium]|nr:transketolase family protein [Oscillospiraceae bacterium]
MIDNLTQREVYGHALARMGADNKKIVVLDADISSASQTAIFAREYPDRFFNVGIAECNMMAMAAGFATCGLVPVVNTFAFLVTLRAGDALRSFTAHDRLNVKIFGTNAGLSNSLDGSSHQSVQAFAILRSMPNLTIIAPSDPNETAAAAAAAINFDGPVYVSIARNVIPYLYPDSYRFKIGRAYEVRGGSDISIIACGYMVAKALEAAEALSGQGISARVINMHTIKPIDVEMVIRAAEETGAIVTIEESSIYGGLGGAVAEIVAANKPVPVGIVGIKDTFAESGDYEGLLAKYGLGVDSIVSNVNKILEMKKC